MFSLAYTRQREIIAFDQVSLIIGMFGCNCEPMCDISACSYLRYLCWIQSQKSLGVDSKQKEQILVSFFSFSWYLAFDPSAVQFILVYKSKLQL